MDAIPLHPASAAPNAAENVPSSTTSKPLNVLMVGTGEYTTGFVGGGASGSDKKVGVVGLTMFDLRRRGKVGKLSMVGTSGTKYPAIREFLPQFQNTHLLTKHQANTCTKT
jgi:D-galacturonate reductase